MPDVHTLALPELPRLESGRWTAEQKRIVTLMLARTAAPPLLARIAALERERDHWKANHDAQVQRARVLMERPDLPLERTASYWRFADLERGHARYEFVRTLAPVYFTKLWQRNIDGEGRFDDLVDAAIEKRRASAADGAGSDAS